MMCRAVVPVVLLVVLALAAGVAMAGDIVTVPTANQVKAGEVDLAAYYIFLHNQPIDFVRAQTMYVGITDKVELDVQRFDVEMMGAETLANATVLVQAETPKKPAVVIGADDLGHAYSHASYFVSAAKTMNPPVGGPPTGPIYRLHLSLGTEQEGILGEGRHEGVFGGLQALLKPSFPQVGLVALYDGEDVITGLTVVPKPKWPTIKGGSYGEHWWVGVSYTVNAK